MLIKISLLVKYLLIFSSESVLIFPIKSEFKISLARFFVSDPDVAGELLSLGLPREAGAGGEDFIHLRVSPHDLEPAGDASLSAVIVVRPSEP